ncbi:ATPase [Clostridia bacterium]|nr:ATPase [Clostridia bacterium]
MDSFINRANIDSIDRENDFSNAPARVISEVEKVIQGKRRPAELLLIALLSGGHVLIEDVPGVGKTTLAAAIEKAAGLSGKRAQFTPDVMASDITGFTVFNKETSVFEYRPGLVNCNVLLADEINRTPPKTQSALLEAMEERRVTVEGVTHKIPEPFMVIATQNELGYIGTYPLPEAQLDRFLMKISMGYPTSEEEIEIISSRRKGNPAEAIQAVSSAAEILQCIEAVRGVNIEPAVYRYIVSVVRATRAHKAVILGASPRGSLLLMRAAQAAAFLSGRNYVIPEDVKKMAYVILSHRITISPEAKLRSYKQHDVITDVLKAVSAPHGS